METYKDPSLSPAQRAADLLGRMTLREKIGQLTQRLYGFACYRRQGDEIVLCEEFTDEVRRFGGLGTLYGLYRADPWSKKNFDTGLDGALAPKARNKVQRYVLEHSRFGIPVLMSSECPHGHQALDGYLLPVNLAAGATWSPALLEAAVRVCARQLRAMGVDLALVSALDVLRDPRWGRSEECYSEDPLLAAAFAAAAVRGMQGEGVDMVAKHLCAQGETTGGVNASAARIGRRELREIHLPAVRACAEAGVTGFMAAYNEIDGVYCHANPWLLQTLLREEYGFTGVVMSDGVAIDQLDFMTGDRVVSGALALNAGVDIGLWDTAFGRLEEAVDRGLVKTETIDRAAARVLTLKFRRGLFEEPFVAENNLWQGYTPAAYPQAGQLTLESAVLLKNRDGLLPLDAARPLRLLVTGPAADDVYGQLGDYTPPVRPGAAVTPLAGLRRWLQEHDSPVVLDWQPGCPRFDSDPAAIAQAVCAAGQADVILAVLGGTSSRFTGGEFLDNGALKAQDRVLMDCGENVDAAALQLPGDQLSLLRQLKATGKPVVTVLVVGRPYAMAEIDAASDAIFCCFYPGLTAGQALAQLVFGEAAPSGRLPVSLPDHPGQLPVYYNGKDSYQSMRYCDWPRPRYGFGSGLTYTDFSYTLAGAPTGEVPPAALSVSITVRNTGRRAGAAVPQLYVHRTQGVVTSRWRALAAFAKVQLDAGEQRTVRLDIPRESLQQWDAADNCVLPAGRIEWFVADGGRERLHGDFTVAPQ